MNYIEVTISFVTQSERATTEKFEECLDSVMDELANIGRTEIELVATLSSRTAVFVEHVEGEGFNEVASLFADLRTALHAAKCGTPQWPDVAQFHGVRTHDGGLTLA